MDPLLLWIVIFIASMVALVKGADWLLQSSEKIGLAIGLPSFVVGVLIVSLGTSFPELVATMFAAFQGIGEFAPANAIGSNIANILLVIGFSAFLAGKLITTKSLIDTELPLLAISTAIFLAVALDGVISVIEATLMLVVYSVYVLYTIKHRTEEERTEAKKLPGRVERRKHTSHMALKKEGGGEAFSDRPRIGPKHIVMFLCGAILLGVGSKYLIDSVVSFSEILGIGIGAITITAVAIGTSLPELLVSAKAALKKHYDVALGNIFGSNAFNMMVVVGLPALFFDVALDEKTYSIGLPFLAVTTFLFVISGISRKINAWEGVFFIFFYIIFIATLLGIS